MTSVRRTTGARRSRIVVAPRQLELPPLPSIPLEGLQNSLDALAPVDIKTITGYLSELRKWDQAAAKIGSEVGSVWSQLA